MLLGQVALVLTSWKSCRSLCRNDSSKSLHLTGVTCWILHSIGSIALWRTASDRVVAAYRALFRRTWNCLRFVVETIPAPHTRASIAAQTLWNFCSCSWWDPVANRSPTLDFADFDIFCSPKLCFFWCNPLSALSIAVMDRSEWVSRLTSRENSHNARPAPTAISSEAVSAAAFLSSLEQTRIGAQLTASVLIISLILLPCQVPLFNE